MSETVWEDDAFEEGVWEEGAWEVTTATPPDQQRWVVYVSDYDRVVSVIE